MTRSKRSCSSESSSSSEDGRKPKKKNKYSDPETSDDSEDTVNKKKDYKEIVLEITNEETDYRHKLYPDFHKVLKEDITCTVCFKDLKNDVLSGKTIFTHPKLNVLQCKKCTEAHNDSDCDGLACMWCKNNDDLFNCVTCTSQLCEDCIKKNLGKKVLKAAEEDDWQCILCNPRVLWKCRAKCWASVEEAKFIKLKKNKNALTVLVDKMKTRTRKPPRRRGYKESESGDDSGDSTEKTSNEGSKGEVHTSEDSDVEDMYSSNREEGSKQCVKKRKLRKNRRSSRSFSENKGDETEDSETDADAKQNGGTPRLIAKRGKNISFAPKTNGKLASSSSDSSSDEDEAHKRRAKGGIEVVLDDFQSVGEMFVDQSKKIKKKLKLALTAGDPNAKGLAIKKMANLVKVGRDTLEQIERELSNLIEGDTGDAAANDSVKDAANEVRDVAEDGVVSIDKDDVASTAIDGVAVAAMDDVVSTVIDSDARAVIDDIKAVTDDFVSAVTGDIVSAVSDDDDDAGAATKDVDKDNDDIYSASTEELPNCHDATSDVDISKSDTMANEDNSSGGADVRIVPVLRVKRLSQLVESNGLEEEPKDVDKSHDMFDEDSFSLKNTENSEENESSPFLLGNAPSVSESSLPLSKDSEEATPLKPDAASKEDFGVNSPCGADVSSDEECRAASPPSQNELDETSGEECGAEPQRKPDVSADEERRIDLPQSSKKRCASSDEELLPPFVLCRNEPETSSKAVPQEKLDASADEKSPKKRDFSSEENIRVASPPPQNETDASSDAGSINEDEVSAKKDLLYSSSDEWDHLSGKGKKRKLKRRKEESKGSPKKKGDGKGKEDSAKRSAISDKTMKRGRKDSSSDSLSSSSDSEEDVHRGKKRAASSDEKPSKKQKPCVEDVNMKNDAKLKADCFVHVKKMSEEDLEEYLSALQEHYLEEDDSRTDRAISRLCNLSNLRRKKRDDDSDKDDDDDSNRDDDDDSNKDDDDRDKSSDKRKKVKKAKEKEKGLMEFLDDDETGEQNSGHLDDVLESDQEKSSRDNGANMWNNMNKEFLLQDSEDEQNDLDKSDSEPEVKLEKKIKVKKEKGESEAEEETAVGEVTVKVEVKEEMDTENVEVKEEVKEEVDTGKDEGESSSKEQTKGSSSDEKSKKKKKNWRKNRLLVGKLSDTDSDAGEAASQRKEEKRAKEGSEEEEDRKNRAKKARRTILKSDSDSDVHSTDKSSSDETVAKKKKKKISKATCSENSTEEEKEVKKKPKRRRIKVQDSSSDSEDQQNEKTDTPNKGRKKIHKVIKDDDLVEETKEAAKVEEERRKRIAERQKMYDEMYEALQKSATEGQNVDKLVLDFDEKTKEPLVEVHPSIVEKLKPHQVKGIKFMWDACYESVERIKKTKGSGCILAHCMGLGKTFQVVALCHTLLRNPACKTERILVVSPLSTVLNWCSEFDKWLKGIKEDDEEIDVYNLTKQKKNYERQYQLKNWQETGGVMVLGYDMYRILSNPAGKRVRANITKTFQETLVDPGPDLVICDEGHLLKNEATALAKSMTRIKTLRRIVLTGTPLQNNLKEYHCMVQFVKPNLLGTRKEFLNRFVNPITNGQFEDSTDHDVRVMKRRAHVLHKMLEGSVQRYDYSVLTPFLPPKQEYVISIRVSELQEKLYDYYLSNFARLSSNGPDEEGGKGRGVALFKDYQNLQRVWTHPLVLKWSTEKQEREREKRAESDSEGSLRDFIDDDETSEDTSESSSSSSSSDNDDIVCLDDDAKDKKKKEKKTKTVGRRTRSSKKDESEEEVIEEAPKHQLWWEQFVTEDNLEDLRESPKLVLLFAVLKECELLGEKVLVFSQSLYSLDLIEHFLERIDIATQNGEDDEKLMNHRGSWTKAIDYFRLDGSTATDIRAAWCKTFNKENNTRGRLFLISTRAGGLGINLVAANRVIIFDASWNPSHDLQSIFRVYRFGQKRPVFVYRFLAQGTMEEKIYERQVTKLSLAGRVVDEHQIDRHYNMADLQELYKFTPHSGPKETPNLPKDRMFADMLAEHGRHIVSFHEHDSLLENKQDEELNEEERKEAWEDYEKEKKGLANPFGFGGMNPGLPSQADVINAVKFNFPHYTEEQLKAALPSVLNDLYKLNASNSIMAGQQMAVMQQMLRPQSRQPTLMQNYQPVRQAPGQMPNYQPPRAASNYQQQQMYAYQQQLRNAQYAQRNVPNPSYQPTPNAQFLPMYPTQENLQRAYGNSFTNSMAFNQPGTSQGQLNRQQNTKVINIQTPSHK